MPAGLRHLALQNRVVTRQDAADLRRFLIWVPDPRGRRGRRYPILPVLCAAASAVLAGARSLVAIGEWIADAPQSALEVLDFPADPLTGVRPAPSRQTQRTGPLPRPAARPAAGRSPAPTRRALA
ncbi:transposase family protein [Streptomyces anulatus]